MEEDLDESFDETRVMDEFVQIHISGDLRTSKGYTRGVVLDSLATGVHAGSIENLLGLKKWKEHVAVTGYI